MIAILDYGLGNVRAFMTIFEQHDVPHRAARAAEDLDGVTHLILPGVGAFDQAMRRFGESGLREPALAHVASGLPLLGVCVGMQMLLDASDEGDSMGLGLISGRTREFAGQSACKGLRIPHMGWNEARANPGHPLFAGSHDARFYFLHSYYCDVSAADTSARTDYGVQFACAASRGNVHGVQFHPEKSHDAGTQLLLNFAGI